MKPLSQAKSADQRLAPIALRRAARAAQREAAGKGTYVVVVENGKIVRKRPKIAKTKAAKVATAR